MNAKKQKKILLPVDGSNRSLNTVRYVGWSPPFRNMRTGGGFWRSVCQPLHEHKEQFLQPVQLGPQGKQLC